MPFPYDKILHIAVGFGVAFGLRVVGIDRLPSAGISFGVGASYEVYEKITGEDYRGRPGTADVWDAVATGIGGVIGAYAVPEKKKQNVKQYNLPLSRTFCSDYTQQSRLYREILNPECTPTPSLSSLTNKTQQGIFPKIQ